MFVSYTQIYVGIEVDWRKKSIGIILQQRSSYRYALLDHDVGRIDIWHQKQLCVGAMIEYVIEKSSDALCFVSSVQLLELPIQFGRSDIVFWHHILELCYYFMPLGSYTAELFKLLSFLYTIDTQKVWSETAKKIYLFKLLTTIGVYTELPPVTPAELYRLLDHKAHEEHNEKLLTLLDAWLWRCVGEHPAIARFKTVRFLVGE